MGTAEARLGHRSLSALSLDAAIQLDRIQSHKEPDLQVIACFLHSLSTFNDSPGCEQELSLTGDPLGVELFNSALHQAADSHVENVDELRAKAIEFYRSMRQVAEGEEVSNISILKATCLGLHQAILSERSPFVSEDDWIFAGDENH